MYIYTRYIVYNMFYMICFMLSDPNFLVKFVRVLDQLSDLNNNFDISDLSVSSDSYFLDDSSSSSSTSSSSTSNNNKGSGGGGGYYLKQPADEDDNF